MTDPEEKSGPSPIMIPLQTRHEEELQGSILLPDSAEAMVILVQVNSNPRQRLINLWVSAVLNHKNIATLTLNLVPRNGRNSNGRRFQLELLAERLAGSTIWLLNQPRTKSLPMGYFGTSIGAAAALEAAAALGTKIAAVVSAGGRPDLVHGSLAKISAATLLIVGERDPLIVELNREAFGELRAEKRLVEIPGAASLFKESGALTKVGLMTVDWFERHVVRLSASVFEGPGPL